MKKCSKCKELKDKSEFSICRRLKDGLRNECKKCDSERSRLYRENNVEKEKIRRRKKYLKNRELEIKKDTEYKKKRMLSDPNYKLLRRIRDRHSKAVKRAGKYKNFRTTDLLGCNSIFLREYIESKFLPTMSWENYGKVWNIDHIYPLSKVDWDNPEMVKMVCHYTNLQPLFCVENIIKSNKII